MLKITIKQDSGDYEPVVVDGVQLSSARAGGPGTLKFTVVKEGKLNFRHGHHVSVHYGTKPVFYGYVFSKSHKGDNLIDVVAYDQIRYLLFKDNVSYNKLKANEVVGKVCKRALRKTGKLVDTKYVIPARAEPDTMLLDIIYNALDITMQYSDKIYCLYDNYGEITLNDVELMKVNAESFTVDESSTLEMSYSASIDDNTYNNVIIRQEDDKGKVSYGMQHDLKNIEKWGLLTYYEESSDKHCSAQRKADIIFANTNKVMRNLTLKTFGNINVRGGSLVYVKLSLGDVLLDNYMLVESVTHTFEDNAHFMDIELKGGRYYF